MSLSRPRVVVYHQTQYHNERYIPLLPLLSTPGVFVTHLILAAIHINDDPAAPTLNDHSPYDARFDALWREAAALQAAGTRVLGMLGGAARGTYARLCAPIDGSPAAAAAFERYYAPLAALVRAKRLDGLDLDVEEETPLDGIVRLIDRLRADFGRGFIITLAPVAPALVDARANLSGFDYAALEALRGRDIAWYNAQFYCNWGTLADVGLYRAIVQRGWAARRVVAGTVTSAENGAGFVDMENLAGSLMQLMDEFPDFGGVMGWEYFNSQPGGLDAPWEWAQWMTSLLGTEDERDEGVREGRRRLAEWEQAGKKTGGEQKEKPKKKRVPVPVPAEFEYFTDGEQDLE